MGKVKIIYIFFCQTQQIKLIYITLEGQFYKEQEYTAFI